MLVVVYNFGWLCGCVVDCYCLWLIVLILGLIVVVLGLFYGCIYDCCCNALFLMFDFVVLCC